MQRFPMLLLATATAVLWSNASQAGDGEVAAGIIGGLAAGALLGVAAAQQPAAPAPVYVVPPPPPRCYLTRGQPVWDEFRGVWIRPGVQVCEPAAVGVVDDEQECFPEPVEEQVAATIIRGQRLFGCTQSVPGGHRAERAQISIEHREALLDMATACAEVAARLDYQFVLIEQFDDLAGEARRNLRAASDGNGQTLQGNGSGQTKQTDGLGGTNKRQSAEYDASAKSVSVA